MSSTTKNEKRAEIRPLPKLEKLRDENGKVIDSKTAGKMMMNCSICKRLMTRRHYLENHSKTNVCVHIEEVRLGDVVAAAAAAAEAASAEAAAAVVPKAKKTTQKNAHVEEAAAPKKNKICDSFPEELMDLYRHSKRLERKGLSDKFTEEMKNARRLVQKMYLTLRTDSQKKEEAAAKPDMSLANAPVFVAPCSEPKQTALHDLAAQYASDSEDDEIFNTNWRPTPAPRRL